MSDLNLSIDQLHAKLTQNYSGLIEERDRKADNSHSAPRPLYVKLDKTKKEGVRNTFKLSKGGVMHKKGVGYRQQKLLNKNSTSNNTSPTRLGLTNQGLDKSVGVFLNKHSIPENSEAGQAILKSLSDVKSDDGYITLSDLTKLKETALQQKEIHIQKQEAERNKKIKSIEIRLNELKQVVDVKVDPAKKHMDNTNGYLYLAKLRGRNDTDSLIEEANKSLNKLQDIANKKADSFKEVETGLEKSKNEILQWQNNVYRTNKTLPMSLSIFRESALSKAIELHNEVGNDDNLETKQQKLVQLNKHLADNRIMFSGNFVESKAFSDIRNKKEALDNLLDDIDRVETYGDAQLGAQKGRAAQLVRGALDNSTAKNLSEFGDNLQKALDNGNKNLHFLSESSQKAKDTAQQKAQEEAQAAMREAKEKAKKAREVNRLKTECRAYVNSEKEKITGFKGGKYADRLDHEITKSLNRLDNALKALEKTQTSSEAKKVTQNIKATAVFEKTKIALRENVYEQLEKRNDRFSNGALDEAGKIKYGDSLVRAETKILRNIDKSNVKTYGKNLKSSITNDLNQLDKEYTRIKSSSDARVHGKASVEQKRLDEQKQLKGRVDGYKKEILELQSQLKELSELAKEEVKLEIDDELDTLESELSELEDKKLMSDENQLRKIVFNLRDGPNYYAQDMGYESFEDFKSRAQKEKQNDTKNPSNSNKEAKQLVEDENKPAANKKSASPQPPMGPTKPGNLGSGILNNPNLHQPSVLYPGPGPLGSSALPSANPSPLQDNSEIQPVDPSYAGTVSNVAKPSKQVQDLQTSIKQDMQVIQGYQNELINRGFLADTRILSEINSELDRSSNNPEALTKIKATAERKRKEVDTRVNTLFRAKVEDEVKDMRELYKLGRERFPQFNSSDAQEIESKLNQIQTDDGRGMIELLKLAEAKRNALGVMLLQQINPTLQVEYENYKQQSSSSEIGSFEHKIRNFNVGKYLNSGAASNRTVDLWSRHHQKAMPSEQAKAMEKRTTFNLENNARSESVESMNNALTEVKAATSMVPEQISQMEEFLDAKELLGEALINLRRLEQQAKQMNLPIGDMNAAKWVEHSLIRDVYDGTSRSVEKAQKMLESAAGAIQELDAAINAARQGSRPNAVNLIHPNLNAPVQLQSVPVPNLVQSDPQSWPIWNEITTSLKAIDDAHADLANKYALAAVHVDQNNRQVNPNNTPGRWVSIPELYQRIFTSRRANMTMQDLYALRSDIQLDRLEIERRRVDLENSNHFHLTQAEKRPNTDISYVNRDAASFLSTPVTSEYRMTKPDNSEFYASTQSNSLVCSLHAINSYMQAPIASLDAMKRSSASVKQHQKNAMGIAYGDNPEWGPQPETENTGFETATIQRRLHEEGIETAAYSSGVKLDQNISYSAESFNAYVESLGVNRFMLNFGAAADEDHVASGTHWVTFQRSSKDKSWVLLDSLNGSPQEIRNLGGFFQSVINYNRTRHPSGVSRATNFEFVSERKPSVFEKGDLTAGVQLMQTVANTAFNSSPDFENVKNYELIRVFNDAHRQLETVAEAPNADPQIVANLQEKLTELDSMIDRYLAAAKEDNYALPQEQINQLHDIRAFCQANMN